MFLNRLAGVFGYLLLYFRCGITPGQAGLSRNYSILVSRVPITRRRSVSSVLG
jgi:hypothetical protein